MSASQEIQNIRTGLEEEARSLNEERTNLEEKVQILRDKIAIEELRKSNAETRGIISQLKTEISELERKLNEPTETSSPDQQLTEIIAENPSTVQPEIAAAEQHPDNKKPEERKRRFF